MSEAAPRVLLEGGLHPATFVLRLGRLGRFLFILALPVVFRGADAAPLDFIGPALTFVALGTIGPLLELVSFRYRLTEGELTIRAGVFARTERRIPVDRIHDVGFEQTPIRRLLGLVRVTVETSGSGGAEATLDALSRPAARALRARLEVPEGEVPRPSAPPRTSAPPSDQATLYRAGARSLLVRGLTDNRAGFFFVAIVSFAELVAIAAGQPLELLLLDQGFRNARVLARTGVATWLLLGILFGLLALAVGWLVSGVVSVLAFHRFELGFRRGLFVRRFGSLTTRRLSVPAKRVQMVRLVQSPLRRLVNVGVLEVESAGSRVAEGEAAASEGTETFVPLAKIPRVLGVAGRVLAESIPGPSGRPLPDVAGTPWRRTSRRIIPRYGMRGLVMGLGAVGVAGVVAGRSPSVDTLLMGAATVGLLGLLAGWARYRALAYAVDGEVLTIRDGLLGRTRTWVPVARLQAASVSQRPIERLQRVAQLEVHVLGGSGVVVPNLPLPDAERLLAAVVQPP